MNRWAGMCATLVLAACGDPGTQAGSDGFFKERRLESLPEGSRIESVAFAPQGRGVAMGYRGPGGGAYVRFKGKDGLPYGNVESLAISADGARFGHVSLLKARRHVVVDGKREDYDRADEPVFFTSDGKRSVYLAGDAKSQFAVVDGVKGPEYLRATGLRLSPDGKRFAYVAMMHGGGTSVVVDGVPGKAWEGVTDHTVTFSEDGSRLGFSAGLRGGGGWRAVVDGKESLHGEGCDWVRFSADGKRVAYHLRTGRGSHVVIDGKESEEHVQVTWAGFSPDGGRVAYVAGDGRKCFTVIDGVKGESYDSIGGGVSFSPDGKRTAFKARLGDRQHVVTDGIRGEAFDDVQDIRFSPDGKRVAYVGRSARIAMGPFLVIDGEKGAEMAAILPQTLAWSPDSRHAAYVGVPKGTRGPAVIAGSKTGPAFHRIEGGSLFWSPDGTKVAYAACTETEAWWKVLDLSAKK